MGAFADFAMDVVQPDGTIETGRLGTKLRVSKLELAAAAGLLRDAVSKTARLNAPAPEPLARHGRNHTGLRTAQAGGCDQSGHPQDCRRQRRPTHRCPCPTVLAVHLAVTMPNHLVA